MVPPKFPAFITFESRDALRRLTSASPVTLGLRFELLGHKIPQGDNMLCSYISLKRLERELQLISVEYNFQRFCCTSLAASASLLSSVTAFDLITVIICENGTMSRLGELSLKWKQASVWEEAGLVPI